MSEDQSLLDLAEENSAEATANEPEDPAATGEVPVQAKPAVPLDEQLALANQRADENWDKLVRVQAEMENLRRRTEKEITDARKFALERFAKELLVVLDSLELGIQAAAGDTPGMARLREGSELTLKQFVAVLEKFNVQSVDPLGQKFNPELHQAMAMEPSQSAEPNTVVKVFQKGYVLNERLLRPAMVVISQGMTDAAHVDEQA